jgi:uncharacterized protein (TIGR02246 family)
MSSRPIAFALVAASLVACGGASSTSSTALSSAAAPRSLRDAQLAALDSLRAAVEAKDAHAAAAVYAQDAVVEPAGGKPQRGRAAIEAAMRDQLAPASTVRMGFGRVWLKGDVAIVEAAFRAAPLAGSRAHDVGETELSVLWFDATGHIAREHAYQEQATLDAQASGEADAEPIPSIPTKTEVHAADTGADDAKIVAWANGVEAAESRSDAEGLAAFDEHVTWDCALGFHGTSRADLAKALGHWRAAFPDEKWVATQVWPVEDYVIVEETFTGTQKGKFGPLEASGKAVTWRWAEVWQVKDGHIARGWSWANFNELRAQIAGPVPPPSVKAACSVEP